MKWKILFLITVFLLAGCHSIGPREINLDRNPYNDAVVNTEDEQLLRNIVRMRYLEMISFLKINNITSSYTLSPSLSSTLSLSGSAAQATASTTSRSVSLSPGITYSDSPTISYTPVTSSDFVQQMLTPISLQSLSLLLNGGIHSPDLVFRLVFNSIDDIDNASDAADLQTLAPPRYEQFHCLIHLMDNLIPKHGIRLIPIDVNGVLTVAIHFEKPYTNSCESRAIHKILHIPQHYQNIILSQDGQLTLPNSVEVTTRSIVGVMVFLSHGVCVPVEHIENKRALRYHIRPGIPYDWWPLMHNLVCIRSSKTEPTTAFVKINMNCYWYYIDWSDFKSIATFSFVNSLIVLSAGNSLSGTSQAPVLTIPTR